MRFSDVSCQILVLNDVKAVKATFSSLLKGSFVQHIGKAGLWTHGLDVWTLDGWTLGIWTTRWLDSGRLGAWILDAWTQEILSIFSDIYFFFFYNLMWNF